MKYCLVLRAQQIVGRERRERASQLDSSGDASLNSRRRVNSAVGRAKSILVVSKTSCDEFSFFLFFY